MMPSRSAQGQISSSSAPKMSMHRVGHQRAGDELVGPVRGDPGQVAPLVVGHPQQLGQPRARAPSADSTRRTNGPSADGRRAADPGQRAEGLRGGDRVVGGPEPEHRSGVAGDLGADVLAQLADRASRRAGPRAATRGSAGPPPAAATARRRAPRRSRRRSPASRRRCRRPSAGPRTSRTTGVRRGRSAGPRPPRAAPRGRPWPPARTRSSTSSELVASRTAEVAKPSISSHPLSSATWSAAATKSRERGDPGLGHARRRRRGARPAAAAA